MEQNLLRLDPGRTHSLCVGERNVGDTHAQVHFFQDNLPFGPNGELVVETVDNSPPGGVMVAITSENGSVRHVRHPPLYTDERRAVLRKKMARYERQLKNAPGDSGPVNFVAWLRGDVDYPDGALFAAAKNEYHKGYVRRRDLVEDLLYDMRIIPDTEADPVLIKLLDA